MNYTSFFKNNDLITIEKFFQYTKNQFKYGWIDQNEKQHNGINDALTYSLQSPQELLNSKIGICWDMTELYRYYFKNMTSLKYETYYLFYDDNKGCPSHSILVFYNDNKVYWFEPMFKDDICYYSGIHEYQSILELLKDFKKTFIKNAILKNFISNNYNDLNFHLYKYEQPNYHINGLEMRKHIDSSQKIEI